MNLEFFGSHLVGEETQSFFVSNARHLKGMTTPVHAHDYGCIHFVLAGVYHEKIENKTFEVEPGEVLYKPAEISHCNCFRMAGSRTCRIQLDSVDRLGVQLPQIPMKLSGPGFSSLFAQLQTELGETDDLSDLAIESLSWQVICQLIRNFDRKAERVYDPKVEQVVQWIKAEYRTPPSVMEIATELGIHRSQLSRLFKKHTHMTIADYVRMQRIKKSIELLQSDHSLSWVALECGFVDQSHFTKSFRKIMNTTPANWRKTVLAGR